MLLHLQAHLLNNTMRRRLRQLAPSHRPRDEAAKEEEDTGPSLVITLLLITGSRHPFKIDGKYLRKRSVNVENYDPFAMSVYTLKELIWREWRQGMRAIAGMVSELAGG
jgi:hypothetical protein